MQNPVSVKTPRVEKMTQCHNGGWKQARYRVEFNDKAENPRASKSQKQETREKQTSQKVRAEDRGLRVWRIRSSQLCTHQEIGRPTSREAEGKQETDSQMGEDVNLMREL